MSKSSIHSILLVLLSVAVLGLLFVSLSGNTSAQPTTPISPTAGRDIVMLRCSFATEDFSTVALQASAEVTAKKGLPCPANVAALTAAGYQMRFISSSDTDKGFFNLMMAR